MRQGCCLGHPGDGGSRDRSNPCRPDARRRRCGNLHHRVVGVPGRCAIAACRHSSRRGCVRIHPHLRQRGAHPGRGQGWGTQQRFRRRAQRDRGQHHGSRLRHRVPGRNATADGLERQLRQPRPGDGQHGHRQTRRRWCRRCVHAAPDGCRRRCVGRLRAGDGAGPGVERPLGDPARGRVQGSRHQGPWRWCRHRRGRAGRCQPGRRSGRRRCCRGQHHGDPDRDRFLDGVPPWCAAPERQQRQHRCARPDTSRAGDRACCRVLRPSTCSPKAVAISSSMSPAGSPAPRLLRRPTVCSCRPRRLGCSIHATCSSCPPGAEAHSSSRCSAPTSKCQPSHSTSPAPIR